MIGSSARPQAKCGRFRTEPPIMPVKPAFGGAARPEGQALGLPA
jgi:hypothetical protein